MKAIIRVYAGTCKRKEKGPGRGWWGPPKGTHEGRSKGVFQKGPGGVLLPQKFSRQDYVTARLWEARGIKTGDTPLVIGSSLDALGPVSEGYMRFYHGTNARNVESILSRGILPGSEADSKERLPMILGTTDGPSGFGEVSFVADLPRNMVHNINDSWAEVMAGHRIGVSSIKGIVLTHISVDLNDKSSVKALVSAYEDYDRLYGVTAQ